MKMLHEKTFIEIGFVRKAYGFEGAIKVVIQEPFIEGIVEGCFIFLDIDGCKIPFEVTSIQENKDTIAKFHFLNEREKILPFHQAPIYRLKEDLPADIEEHYRKNNTAMFVGLQVCRANGDPMGQIERIDEYPQQQMAVVLTETGEQKLIPLVDAFIIRVEPDRIIMDLPEGLV